MSKSHREHLDIARGLGLHKAKLVTRGKHMSIVFTHEGEDVVVVFPASGSDHRGLMNFRAFLKRKLKELGGR